MVVVGAKKNGEPLDLVVTVMLTSHGENSNVDALDIVVVGVSELLELTCSVSLVEDLDRDQGVRTHSQTGVEGTAATGTDGHDWRTSCSMTFAGCPCPMNFAGGICWTMIFLERKRRCRPKRRPGTRLFLPLFSSVSLDDMTVAASFLHTTPPAGATVGVYFLNSSFFF